MFVIILRLRLHKEIHDWLPVPTTNLSQNFRLLGVHLIVIPHIVNIIIKRVDVVAGVMLRHSVFFAVLGVIEDGCLSNFMR